MPTFHPGKYRLSTAIGRWAAIGPYYAMFPIPFAFSVVETYCKPGGAVLDPFAGRASSIYAAAATGRYGYGIEISPIGWLYGRVKLNPAESWNVMRRARQIARNAQSISQSDLDSLPEFFTYCYSPRVLRFLLAARAELDWRSSQIDRTLMAILSVYLHGSNEKCLSNQTRQGKAMAPEYSVKWWKTHNATPPDIDPLPFLVRKINWRYEKGKPNLSSDIVLGDSKKKLKAIKKRNACKQAMRFDLLFTSPPYCGVTNYHYDQWLRLWMLGGDAAPIKGGEQSRTDFANKDKYRDLLETVFHQSARLLNDDAIVYVRTDARRFTFETTKDILGGVFPDKELRIIDQPLQKNSQTALYGDKTPKPGEKDILLCPR